DDETAYRITVDGSGNAYIAGETDSTTFPTRNPIQAQNAGDDDTFLVKLNTAGSPVYATYLGGNGIDYPYGLGVDAGGNVVMGGFTTSDNFPTLNAVDATKDTHADAFMARINSAGSALTYSTYLGGTFGDVVYDLVVDGAGNAYATGSTESRNFPTTPGAYQVEGFFGAFVFKMSPGGSLVFSTYLGTATDGTGIGIDPLGRIIVTGEAGSAFPLVNPTQPVYGDNDDGFVSVLNASGSALLFSTYIGGSGYDFGHGLAADGSGAYIVGQTTSHDFPLKNPFQTSAYGSGGIYDLWVAKFAFDDPAPAVQGRTWYDDGSSLKGGPAATTIRVYGTGAVPGTAYRLVLARGDNLRRCADNVVTLSGTNRTASAAGFIGATIGTIPTGTPPGQYHICFKATTGATVMSPVLFNVS
ncbi:MAG: SBBP repeat-containing protein, partial [Acidimicrobiales bacterium]